MSGESIMVEKKYISDNAKLMGEWDWIRNNDAALYPDMLTCGSDKKVWWICKNGHSFCSPISNRAGLGNGCPYCANKKVLMGYNDLETINPILAKEWNYDKNIGLKPSDITAGSNKKVWWICNRGHEWQANIYNRNKGSGCPYCSGRKVIQGENDLQTVNPNLALEWDYEKNNDLVPTNISAGSNQKVWWICKKGHSWYASPSGRKNSGCPTCSIEKHTSFPEQAIFFYIKSIWHAESRYRLNRKELDIFIPELNIGIEYDGEYYHRSDKAKLREKEKDEFFASKQIKIIRIKEWSQKEYHIEGSIYYYCPDVAYKNLEQVLVDVFSELGVKPSLVDIDIERDRSAILEQFWQFEKESSVSQARPDLAAEWDYEMNQDLRPDQINIYSKLKVHWICGKGHRWSAAVYSRSAGNGCPHCSGQMLTVGENDLKSQNPTLCEEWDYAKNANLLPEQITVNNGRKVWWKCRICSHSWQASVAHRNNDRGCPVCSKKMSTQKANATRINISGSFKAAFPNIASEWNYQRNIALMPEDFTPNSGQKVWWKCAVCSNEWKAYISNRVKGSGCPECSRKQRINTATKNRIQENGSLADRFPAIATEWDYKKNDKLTPTHVTPGSSRKVWWKCSRCGHEWAAIISNRTGKGRGCPACAKANASKRALERERRKKNEPPKT